MFLGGGLMMFLLFIWWAIIIVQSFFAYGTAYRLTKKGGDNGVALFGWLLLMNLAASIPGLGIWLWLRHREGPGRYGHLPPHERPDERWNNRY